MLPGVLFAANPQGVSVSRQQPVNTQTEPVLKERLLPAHSQPELLAGAELSQPVFNSHSPFRSETALSLLDDGLKDVLL